MTLTPETTLETTAVTPTVPKPRSPQQSEKWEGWRGGELKIGHGELGPADLDTATLAELETELAELRSGITGGSRMRDIMAVLSKHGLLYFLKDSSISRTVRGKRKNHDRNVSLEELGVRVRNAFQELGPTFIKLGQVLVTRQELIPEQITHQLAQLLDAIPPVPFPYLATLLENELPQGLATFRWIDFEKPVGSASLAQVYRAELADGTPVAVKIIRPGVPELFNTDIKVIGKLAKLAQKALPAKLAVGLDLPGLIREYYASAEDELDLRNEAQAMVDHGRMIEEGGFETLAVPKVHIATRNVLIQQFVDGWNLKSFPVDFLSFDERLERMTDFAHWYIGSFLKGYYHADPHASNVLLDKHSKKVYVIDWGMTGRMDSVQTEALFRLLLHVRLNQQQDAVEAALDIISPTKYTDLTKLKDELRALFIHYVTSHQASRYNWGNLLISIIRIGMLNYGRVPTGLALFAKGWSAAEGTGRWLAPEISYHELVETADIQIMKSFLGRRFDYRANAALTAEAGALVAQLPRRLNKILEYLAANDLRIKQEYTIAPDTMKGLRKVGNRVGLAIVAAPAVYLKFKGWIA